MTSPRQKTLISALVENIPTILFFTALQAGPDLRSAGWVGCVAAMVIAGLYLRRIIRPNTIMLGINLYMLVVTPVAELLHLSGWTPLALAIADNAASLMFVGVFMTGVVLTIASREGFVGVPFATERKARRASAPLLLASFLTIVWTFSTDGDRFVSLALPLLCLFALQNFLRARALDREETETGSHLALLSAPAAPATMDDGAVA